MKQLRQYIRQILLEDKASFMEELIGDPNWDEGTDANLQQLKLPPQVIYPNARKRGRLVKKTWAKHVDRNFVDSLIYVHWSHYEEYLLRLIEDSRALERPSRDEISCEAYLPGEIGEDTGQFGSVGLIIKGYVSLLGNEMSNMVSGYLKDLRKWHPEHKNTSGISRGVQSAMADTYVLDKQSFASGKTGKEAFLDNWYPVGIVTLKPGSKKGKTYGEEGIGPRSWNSALQLQKDILKLTGIELPVYHMTDLNNIEV